MSSTSLRATFRTLGIVLPLIASAPAPAQQPDDATAAPRTLAPTGRHTVGRRLLHWVDRSRRDPSDSTRDRELMVWVWYPADRRTTADPEVALDGSWGDRHAADSAPKIGEAAASSLRRLRISARTDAPLLAGRSALPVLLFMPGLGWLPPDYSTLVEEMASHGYVVVGVAPTGLSAMVRFPDGREAPRTLGVGEKIGLDQVHAHHDARFAASQLRSLNEDPASPFRGRLDLTRVGAFGHSLGGTASLVLASHDSSIRAAINVDGDPMGVVLEARPRQPVLLISSESPPLEEGPPPPDSQYVVLMKAGLERSERRRTNDWERIAQASVRATRVRVLGARHSNFADISLVASQISDRRQRWMRVGPIDGARALRIAADLVLSFFDHTLRGAATTAILEHPERVYPEARREGAGAR